MVDLYLAVLLVLYHQMVNMQQWHYIKERSTSWNSQEDQDRYKSLPTSNARQYTLMTKGLSLTNL